MRPYNEDMEISRTLTKLIVGADTIRPHRIVR